MDELFAVYVDPVPPAVLELDYLGREVVLDARDGDFKGATAHVDAIANTFEKVRAELVADGGASQASGYDASVAALRADIDGSDATQLEVDANDGLELVDGMEGVFTNAAAAEGGEVPD